MSQLALVLVICTGLRFELESPKNKRVFDEESFLAISNVTDEINTFMRLKHVEVCFT